MDECGRETSHATHRGIESLGMQYRDLERVPHNDVIMSATGIRRLTQKKPPVLSPDEGRQETTKVDQ